MPPISPPSTVALKSHPWLASKDEELLTKTKRIFFSILTVCLLGGGVYLVITRISPPQNLRSLLASEHTLEGKPVQGGRVNFPLHAAGPKWTTPGDLALFMIDLMQAYQGENDHLLSPAMAQEMMSPQIEIPDSPLSEAYGIGVELKSTSQGPIVWHSGGTWGSCSLIWFYPQFGKGAVVMVNSASGSLLRLEILLSIALAYGWPFD
ncbi:MAG TPA: serine hydrolase domain-containing protein [Anaerolineales bacterium]|nr:serine hydrolase domain-containing protein [Anaerolineales bacterium]